MPRYIFPASTVTNTTGAAVPLAFYATSATGRRETDLWTVDGSSNLLERIPNGIILADVTTGAYSAFAGPDDVDTLYLSANGGARTAITATTLVTGQGGTYLNGTFAKTWTSPAASTTLTGTLAAWVITAVDCTAGAGARALPAANSVTAGTSVSAKKADTSANNLVVSRAGSDLIYGTGAGATSKTLSLAGEAVEFVSNGVNKWTVRASDTPSGVLATTYAIKGRRSLSVYDEFSRYADGVLSGKTPIIGSAWTTSGAQPTTVASGQATSTGTGYAAQILAATVKSIACEVVWSGTGTNQAMTLIASIDSSITIANAVHFNFGPAGFTLTLRKDAGTFDSLVFGNWRQAMKVDAATVYRVGMLIRGNTVLVFGPNGEQYANTDPRVGLLAGTMAVWEPNTASGTVAGLVSAAATSEASTGNDFPYAIAGDNGAAGLLIGPQGQVSGNRNSRTEVSIGTDNTSGLPALTFGPLGSILGVLQAATIAGATSISTDVYIPTGSTVQLESGTNAESVTASGNSTGTGPYATVVGAASNAHAAGTSVIITVPASYIAKFTSNAGTVTAPASVIFTNIYGSGQTVRLTQGASGVWDISGSVGTIKGGFKTGQAATGSRPSASTAGAGVQFYDTTLGLPIWSNGTVWKDAAGNTV